ncbi:twin-arginine translocase TatA/TatE family subunit [Xiamenia xianingshaonis]|uniref:Sec-independent protein translocase protein TatA n=1 Tax=Xiamenia xianingshaonis TaxID=2682776 RepID=A0A9E6MRV2_9ACTN|nr:twin-arginine translocase TatA/TatE family subunit [Xiamenia xianingshaonis]NHM13317.1 twin-arginine translocase TatA/TatE family subunit [Xiamenia xianingshaonis]QTU84601.1 twin-arginine translocase TatA/TatE family subunit [Xiamenia xianingshaonis]
MRVLGMGVPELLIILAVILLIFGPKNLPKLGNALGKTVKGLREGMAPDKPEENEVYESEEYEEEVEETPKKKRVVKRIEAGASESAQTEV